MKDKSRTTKATNDPLSLLSDTNPWEQNDNPIWLTTTIKFFRNIDKFQFPGKLSTESRKQILSLIEQGLSTSTVLDFPKLYEAEDLTPLDKEFLFEHFLSQQSFHQAQSGEGFILDNSGEFIAVINIRDHLQLQLTDWNEELEQTLNKLVLIENEIGKFLNYAFSTQFGFITADSEKCGTGLKVYIFLHVPALINSDKLDSILKSHIGEGMTTRGLQGDSKELIGDILVLTNKYTFGLTEENIISTIRTTATKLMLEEKTCRLRLCTDSDASIKDKVSRAYGLLKHSYQLETVEAMNAISMLKLGAEYGWVSGLNIQQLHKLFFNCRRAHLLHTCGKDTSTEEIAKKRSEVIHAEIKNAKLNF